MGKRKVPEKLKSMEFWRKIGKVAILYIVVFIILVVFLRIYTHHGKSVPVPDFKGLSQDRAIELARQSDMDIVVNDSIFMDYLPKGCVLDQNPKPGVRVKRHRTIFVTTNALNQIKVEMPQIIGLSYRDGKATLEMRGLKVGKLIYKPDFAENNILKQMYQGKEILTGTRIEKGQSIDLVLGDGNGGSTYPTPNLIRMDYNQAVNEISNAYFNMGQVTFDESVKTLSDSLDAIVWKQTPEYFKGNRSIIGSKISIWLTTNPEKLKEKDTPNLKANDQ
jgi:eukaryotic-like serine/threonine-protein kinase